MSLLESFKNIETFDDRQAIQRLRKRELRMICDNQGIPYGPDFLKDQLIQVLVANGINVQEQSGQFIIRQERSQPEQRERVVYDNPPKEPEIDWLKVPLSELDVQLVPYNKIRSILKKHEIHTVRTETQAEVRDKLQRLVDSKRTEERSGSMILSTEVYSGQNTAPSG